MTTLSNTDVIALSEMKARARLADGPVHAPIAGWSVRLTRAMFAAGTTHNPQARWALSCRLDPVGRSSSDSDWNRLGRIAALLGAPEKPAIPIAQTDPSGWHEWRWME